MADEAKLEIEYVDVDELVPYANNSKLHDAAQVKTIINSIEEFDMCDPVGVWTNADGKLEIVEGHGRILALKELGEKKVPVIRLDHLSDAERRGYSHIHNKTTVNSGFDEEILFKEMDELDFNWEDFGFDVIEDLENPIDDNQIKEVEVPETAPRRAEYGDVWQLGKHRVMCGSCTNKEDMKKLMDGNIADIAFASPPYNVGASPTDVRDGHTSKYNGNNDGKSQAEYVQFLKDYIMNAMLYSQYVFMNIQSLSGNKLALIDVLYELKDVYADTIIWDKGHVAPAMAHKVLNSSFEYVHVFSKQATRAIGTVDFRGTVDNVLRMPPQRDNKYASVHNATFSVELAAWFVKNFASNSVLDSFGGTGTTLIAAEQLGKTCYTIDIEPKYCDIILQRWEDYTGKKAVKS